MNAISIRPLTELADIKPVEEIQMQAWERDPIQVIPAHVLKAAQYNGCSLLGAFDNDKLVGYAYAILGIYPPHKKNLPGRAADNLQFYSHQLATLPDYQSQGIGRCLKLAQREAALQLEVNLITWTFDPLMSRNAWLNLGRLGGITQTYMPDYYGNLDAAMSDRFHLEWWIDSDRVNKRLTGDYPSPDYAAVRDRGAIILNPATVVDNDILQPAGHLNEVEGDMALIEIPADFPAIVHYDRGLGVAWRRQTRDLFMTLFGQGFMATDFVRHQDKDGRPRSFYLLAQQDMGTVLTNNL